ncbi:MAG: SET domain-containing protein-lysine N-methyltransferase [Mycobacterium sp.]
MDYNWLTPKAEARPSGEKGWGSYAVEPVPAGETVAAFGGWVVTGATLAGLSAGRQSRSIQVDTDLYLVSGETPEPGDMLNHSCEPNCGLLGQMQLVAMRDIAPGEELCFDYAMCDASDYDEFRCLCGEQTCRTVVTGSDWRNPELQEKYAGWFSPYLARKIAALPAQSTGRRT